MASKKSNPRNEESVLYKQLTRLFSGPIVNYRKQTQRNMRQRHMEKFGTKFYSVHGQTFKKERYDPFASLQTSIMVNHMRATRYGDFEQMEFDPIIASCLDVFADELTTSTHLDPLLRIKCPNDEIKDVLRVLYSDILNLEFNVYGWARSLCKHGDLFLYLDIDDKMGIKNTIAMPSLEIERLEGEDKTNPNYVQFQWNAGHMTFENWQIAHFRLLGNDKYCPYGTSVLDPARRVWRQLCYSKETKVWTKMGYKEIQFVEPNEIVYCFDKDQNKVVETRVKKVAFMGKQKLVEIQTNHRKIKVTPNHGVYVKTKNGEVVSKQAKDLICSDGNGGWECRCADRLILPYLKNTENNIFKYAIDKREYSVRLKKGFNFDNIKLEEIKSCTNYNVKNVHSFLGNYEERKIPYSIFCEIKDRFNLNDEMVDFYYQGSKNKSFIKTIKDGYFKVDKEISRLFGFMLGDGWLGRCGFGIALGVDDEQNDYYVDIIQEKLLFDKYVRTEAVKNIRGGQINFCSIEIKNLFEKLGFISGFEKKKIPFWVYDLSRESRVEFLKGIMDADGCWSDGRIAMSNKRLLEDIRILAQQTGVIVGNEVKMDREAGIYEDKRFGKINRKDSYRLYINLDKVQEEEIAYETVCRVVDAEEGDTYDLEVEHESHNFVSEGIVASNTLLEDAMMAYRIVRSPERRVFYIDVGNIDPNDVEQFMEKVKTNLKRNQIVDVETGRVDLRYNPTSIEEDYFIPVRGGTSSTKIETLPGGTYTGDIEDVQYLKDKLFAALKVPQSYLSRGEGADEDKTTLAQKDVRFARTIQRIQRSIISELEKIGIIHLYILGYRKEDLISFNLTMNNPSKIAELQELEHWRTKFDIASSATEGYFSKRWIAEKIFSLSQEEYLRLQREMFFDRDLSAKLDSIGTAEEGGGGEGGLGGGLGGEGEELGAGEGEELGAGEEEAAPEEEEEGMLLAAPGKRDDKARLTPGAKGKIYFPVTSDKRDMGARKRSYHGLYGQESAGSSKRSLFKGYSELSGLSRGVAENIYDKEERKLLKENHELKLLLDSLEKKTKLNIIDKEDKKDEDK